MEKVKLFVLSLVRNDYVRRVFHTFWQAAGGVLLSALVLANSTQDVKLAFAAAFAAGLAAVKALFVAKRA